jgi:hypothetical protein
MLRWTAKVSSKCVRGYEEGVVPVTLRKSRDCIRDVPGPKIPQDCIAARKHASKRMRSSRPAKHRFVNVVPCHRAC